MGLFDLGLSIRMVLLAVLGVGFLGASFLAGLLWAARSKPKAYHLTHRFEGSPEGRCPLCGRAPDGVRKDVVS